MIVEQVGPSTKRERELRPAPPAMPKQKPAALEAKKIKLEEPTQKR
jgi:hypothetical protein